MLKNYLLITLRSLRKHPAYTLINVFGLAIGLACCLLILLYLQDELTADRFHGDADRIYRLVETQGTPAAGDVRIATSVGPVAPALEEAFPEVEQTVRMLRMFRPSIRRGAQGFYEAEYLITEPSFFEIFDFEVVQGDPVAALAHPGFVVLTASAAHKYFGDEDPMGQTFTVDSMGEMEVAAILRDPPRNTHLAFSMLFSLETMKRAFGEDWEAFVADWHPNSRSFVTYLKLEEGTAAATLEATLPTFFAPHRDEENPEPHQVALQPLTEVYLGSTDILNPFGIRRGERAYLYIFSAIALFIVLIACINYMNLATARSMRRAKEVGLRKTIGAHRSQLIRQFLSEAVFMALAALVLALGLAQIALPLFNSLANKDLALTMLENVPMVLLLAGLVLAVGLVAGSYPAFFLARFRPAQVLKGSIQTHRHTALLRRGLVVAQFTLSIAMIIGTLIAADQLGYMRTKHLGFEETQKLIFDINSGPVRQNADAIKAEFLQHAAVENVSVTSRLPGDWKTLAEIDVLPEGQTDVQKATFFSTDADFLSTFEVALADGRGFDEGRPADSMVVLLNETAVRAFGLTDPIGQRIRIPRVDFGASGFDVEFEGTVVGVMRDFHFHSLHEPIRPLVIGKLGNPIHRSDYITASVATADLPATIAALSEIMRQIDPESPVEYHFLDQQMQDFYTQDARVGQLFSIAAGLAILVACLGLFGLAAFTAEQRTKEIGVRKVLGASVGGIITLLSKDFLQLVGLAFVLAAPLAYFAMQRWLDDFAYRVEISWLIFLYAGLTALGVALLTVSYQAIRAALADPVKSLRYE